MLYYLLLLCMPVVSCCQNISQKQYTLKISAPNTMLFSSITAFIALCFFIVTSGFDLQFVPELIPYALGFAVCYAAAWAGTILGLRNGPMAITNLIISYSLIFPTIYGVTIGETVTPTVIIGILLLLSSFVCVNFNSGSKGRFSAKWFFCVMIAFTGNGFCSIMQNMQKRALGDSYTHEFMIIALSIASVMLFMAAMFTGKDIPGDLKACAPYAAANGVANALGNMILLTIIGNIPNTILYPTNSALGMIGVFLLSFIIYKERFSKQQYAGYALGMVSLILLNI